MSKQEKQAAATAKRIAEIHAKILDLCKSREFTLTDDLTRVTNQSCPFSFLCKCGDQKSKSIKEIYRGKDCRGCISILLREIPKDMSKLDDVEFLPNEEWRTTEGGFVSNLGRAVNALGKLLTADEKDRYHLAGKHQYKSVLVAKAFKIAGVEKLHGQKSNAIVSVDQTDPLVPLLDRLKIATHNDVGAKNGAKARQSDEWKATREMSVIEHCSKFKHAVIPELPYHNIFEDGSIYNRELKAGSNRFLAFSTTASCREKQYKTFTAGNHKHYYVHRIVCIAFHPIEGKVTYDDYAEMEVNHKDGNTLNNHKDNLEWVTHSENMLHSYAQGLNKKVRAVCKFALDGLFIEEHPSIAEAARQCGIPEHRIRECARGKAKPVNFMWKYKDESQNEAFTKKFSKTQ